MGFGLPMRRMRRRDCPVRRREAERIRDLERRGLLRLVDPKPEEAEAYLKAIQGRESEPLRGPPSWVDD